MLDYIGQMVHYHKYVGQVAQSSLLIWCTLLWDSA